jgi:hypothetical protein
VSIVSDRASSGSRFSTARYNRYLRPGDSVRLEIDGLG